MSSGRIICITRLACGDGCRSSPLGDSQGMVPSFPRAVMMNMTMPRNVPNFAAAYLLIAGVAACASDPVSQSQLRESIQRSLPATEADGVKWMRTQNCISCHNVSFLLWSHNLAKSRGIKIDDAKLGQ